MFNPILLSFILSFQSMQRKTRYTRTYQVFELSANVPKFIFSKKKYNVLCQRLFRTDAVKILPRHYHLYIYFLFTVNSQSNNYHFPFAVPIRCSINRILFFFSSFVLTLVTIPLTNCSCSSSVPVLVPVVPLIFFGVNIGLMTYF